MPKRTLEGGDEGKRVYNIDGTEVGRIVEVTDDGRGYVEPDPSLAEIITIKLGWGEMPADAHPLDEGSIKEITDDGVYLRGTL